MVMMGSGYLLLVLVLQILVGFLEPWRSQPIFADCKHSFWVPFKAQFSGFV